MREQRAELWSLVLEELRAGRNPQVSISYEMLVVPERKKPGPKKKLRVPRDERKLAGSVMGGQARPKCLNPHCRKMLHKGDDFQRQVCGEGCRKAALMAYKALVLLLGEERESEDDVEQKARIAWAERRRKAPHSGKPRGSRRGGGGV